MNIKAYLKLIRVHQWVKNVFVFIPLVFSGDFIRLEKIELSLIAFVSFCLIASSMYILNDLSDIESDRKHPTKKFRPLAAGVISKRNAVVVEIIFALLSLSLAYYLGIHFFGVILLYILVNLLYSSKLKNIPILDLIILSSFYIIRIYAGASAIDVPVTSWLLLTAFFATLFIGSGKRYVELITHGSESRKVLKYYSKEFLNYALHLSSFCTILFYSLYSISRTNYYQISIGFVVAGFLIYFYYLYKEEVTEDPVLLILKNKALLLITALWGIFILAILYLGL